MAIVVSLDYGRRAEYLTSVLLSPYALTIPIRGPEDRFGSDFLCVGLRSRDIKTVKGNPHASPHVCVTPSLFPDLELLFWVQTKSKDNPEEAIEIESPSVVNSILNNKMPYFIAIVGSSQSPPKLSLYATSERIALKHLYPHSAPSKIRFIPLVSGEQQPYRLEDSGNLAIIYMGRPFLEFQAADCLHRDDEMWATLVRQISLDRFNFVYATTGLGCYRRKKRDLSYEEKIFYPEDARLTPETKQTIQCALKMLQVTNRENNSEVDAAIRVLLQALQPSEPEAIPSLGYREDEKDEE